MNTTEPQNTQSRLNLSICGGEHTRVNLDEVKAVVTPEQEYRKERNRDGTLSVSYQPIGHNLLIEKTKKHLGDNGFTVQGESHNLARDGKRYFGSRPFSVHRGRMGLRTTGRRSIYPCGS